MKQAIGIVLAMTLVVLLACSQHSDWNTKPAPAGRTLAITMPLGVATSQGFRVTRVRVAIESEGFSEAMDLTIAGDTASGVFINLEPATYTIAVEVYDGAALIAEGSGEGEVLAGETTTIHIDLAFHVGNLEIVVEWPGGISNGPEWTWVQPNAGNGFARDIVQTPDGGYAITGGTNTWPSSDTFLVKLSAEGEVSWNKAHARNYYDQGSVLRVLDDTGFIVAGFASMTPPGMEKFYLVRTDAGGSAEWTALIGTDSYAEYLVGLDVTADGGFILTGFTGPWDFFDVYLIKTDASGQVEWQTSFGEAGLEWGSAVLQTRDGGYIVCGRTNSQGAGDLDVYVLKTDAAGQLIWSRTYGGSQKDFGRAMAASPDGGFVIAAETWSYGNGEGDGWLVKIDDQGNQLWSRAFGGPGQDSLTDLSLTRDHGWVAVGETTDAGNLDGWLVRTDASGELVREERLGGDGDDHLASVIQDQAGGFVTAGWTKSYSSGNMDVWVVRLNH